MKHVVKLEFFQDDATGDYGVAHVDTYCDHSTNGFNAFWNGIGIFHDVFEHWFEKRHKYFYGDNAMNIGGEMVAMGGMWYYINELGIGSIRRLNPHSMYSDSDQMRLTTEGEIEETIRYGYTQFGSTLECAVPYQKPIDDGELEYQCEKMWGNIQKMRPESEDKDDKERGREYKKSVTLGKIQNLHRYGFRLAEKLVPNNWENRDTCENFIKFWNDVTKNNNAESLSNYFKGITVTVTKRQGKIKWSATFIGKDGIKDIVVKENSGHWIEDMIMEQYMDEETY
jgi:hypothetical protein